MLLAIIKFVLPIFLQDSTYELQRDEYLYYEQGQHFAAGYLENPPLLSWLATISSWFGGSVAWIKLWPCLFGAATLVLTCLIAAELGGRLFAQFLAGLSIITGAYMRIHALFQPNIPDIFCWTLAAYFLIRFINTNQYRFIYWLALSLALGWWSKYSIVFMALAIIIGLLLSPYRKIFADKRTWLASGLAFLLIAPNLYWQYSHNWPLIHHMRELTETQLRYNNKTDFLKDQLLLLVPVIFVWIEGIAWYWKQSKYRIMAIIFFAVILLLLFGSGKGYYALGAYPMLLAAGAVMLEQVSENKRWIRYVFSAVILLLAIPLIPVLLPVWKPEKLAAFYKKYELQKTGILKWEDQRDHELPQDFADMLGWKELAEKAERFYQTIPDSARAHTAIYCRNYGQAGALKFYGKDAGFRKNVFSDNGSFLLWIPTVIDMQHLVFIGRSMPGKDDEVFNHFSRVTLVDSVTYPMSRQLGDKIIFFANIDSAGLRLAHEGLQEMKARYSPQRIREH